jgi:hypothetical protein
LIVYLIKCSHFPELTALEIVSKRSVPSLMLRSACVASTLMLIASLINYHRTEVKIALIDSGAESVKTFKMMSLKLSEFLQRLAGGTDN